MTDIQKNKAEAMQNVAEGMAKYLKELLDLGIDSFATYADTAMNYMDSIKRIIEDK